MGRMVVPLVDHCSHNYYDSDASHPVLRRFLTGSCFDEHHWCIRNTGIFSLQLVGRHPPLSSYHVCHLDLDRLPQGDQHEKCDTSCTRLQCLAFQQNSGSLRLPALRLQQNCGIVRDCHLCAALRQNSGSLSLPDLRMQALSPNFAPVHCGDRHDRVVTLVSLCPYFWRATPWESLGSRCRSSPAL